MALLVVAVLSATPAVALADFSGRVVKVQDGDSLTVLSGKQRIRVRLEGIDAPELGQAFGRRARAALDSVCSDKDALVQDRGKDYYGRTIGRVSCAGVDANSELVRLGFAWVFVKYTPPGSPLYRLEADAKARRAGLWAEGAPLAPWEWRRIKSRGEVGQ